MNSIYLSGNSTGRFPNDPCAFVDGVKLTESNDGVPSRLHRAQVDELLADQDHLRAIVNDWVTATAKELRKRTM